MFLIFWHGNGLWAARSKKNMKNQQQNKKQEQIEFTEDVLKNSGATIVNFIATWSGKCQLALPSFQKLSKQYQSHAGFYTVDIDKNKPIADKYAVNELPHVLFFKGSELVDQAIGTVPPGELEKKIVTIIS